MKYLLCGIIGVAFGFVIFCLLYRQVRGKRKNRKKFKPNFTKTVLVAVLFTYFVGFIIGIKITLEDFEQFGVLATYIAAPTTTVIALYCWKAKAENLVKIKKGYPEETKDIPIDLNNIDI